MAEALQLQLDDGTTFEAVLEGDLTDEDILRSGGRLRIVVEDQDVEGHGAARALDVIVYGPDDVEGHAMTLKLPHADAARDLQRKLMAAGVVGVIIVGAATTAMWVPDLGASKATDTPAAAPAPISRGLQAEREDAIVATPAVPVAPPSRGLQAEREDAIVATPAVPVAPPSSGIRAEREDAIVATPEVPATQAEHQGMRPE